MKKKEECRETREWKMSYGEKEKKKGRACSFLSWKRGKGEVEREKGGKKKAANHSSIGCEEGGTQFMVEKRKKNCIPPQFIKGRKTRVPYNVPRGDKREKKRKRVRHSFLFYRSKGKGKESA